MQLINQPLVDSISPPLGLGSLYFFNRGFSLPDNLQELSLELRIGKDYNSRDNRRDKKNL